MLSVSSKSLAIIKLLVRSPFSKYLRGPPVGVDHSLYEPRLCCRESKNFTVIEDYQGLLLLYL